MTLQSEQPLREWFATRERRFAEAVIEKEEENPIDVKEASGQRRKKKKIQIKRRLTPRGRRGQF